MNIKIEKGIPVSSRNTGFTNAFRRMSQGDSFSVETAQQANSARTSARAIGIKITVRKEEDKFRIWHAGKAK